MRTTARLALAALMALAPAAATGQTGLSFDSGSGLGLKLRAPGAELPAYAGFGTTAVQAWETMRGNFALYGGGDEVARLGAQGGAAYAGIVYSRPGWGTSLELTHTRGSLIAPQRYALTGQLHAPLSASRSLNVGLKYRDYDADAAMRHGPAGDVAVGNAYTLAGTRPAGYQLQMSYQYSAAGSLGLAVGREIETFTPFWDSSASGPRQFGLTGQHWLTPSWALSYDILTHDVATPLRVQGLRLGVRYRF